MNVAYVLHTNKWSDYNVYAGNLNFCNLVSGSQTAWQCASKTSVIEDARRSARCCAFVCIKRDIGSDILFGGVFV